MHWLDFNFFQILLYLNSLKQTEKASQRLKYKPKDNVMGYKRIEKDQALNTSLILLTI